MQRSAEKDMNRNSNNRFEEVQHIQKFDLGQIRMKKKKKKETVYVANPNMLGANL